MFFLYLYVDHRYLHVLTHSVPTRLSSDLAASGRVRSSPLLGQTDRFQHLGVVSFRLLDELGEIRPRLPGEPEATIVHELLELGALVDLVERLGQLFGDILRHALRPGNAAPGTRLDLDTHRIHIGRAQLRTPLTNAQ